MFTRALTKYTRPLSKSKPLQSRLMGSQLFKQFGWKDSINKIYLDTFGDEADDNRARLDEIKAAAKKRREELEAWENMSEEEKQAVRNL